MAILCFPLFKLCSQSKPINQSTLMNIKSKNINQFLTGPKCKGFVGLWSTSGVLTNVRSFFDDSVCHRGHDVVSDVCKCQWHYCHRYSFVFPKCHCNKSLSPALTSSSYQHHLWRRWSNIWKQKCSAKELRCSNSASLLSFIPLKSCVRCHTYPINVVLTQCVKIVITVHWNW